MLPNVLLTLHPQLKNSHSKMSGSRRCPASTRPSPCPSWRDRALASCTTQPSPAVRSLTGRVSRAVWCWMGRGGHFEPFSLCYCRCRHDSDGNAQGKGNVNDSEKQWNSWWRLNASKLSRWWRKNSGHLFCSFTAQITPRVPLVYSARWCPTQSGQWFSCFCNYIPSSL